MSNAHDTCNKRLFSNLVLVLIGRERAAGTAKQILKKGYEIEEIVELTGLKSEEVVGLRKDVD